MAAVSIPKKPGAAASAGAVPRSADAGDEVFFHKNGQPVSGKVVCAGRHGCTVEHEGAHHRVRWEFLSGHKKRGEKRYRVLEQGADGMIVADQSGKRRYVGIPPEARDERLQLAKSSKPSKPEA